MKRNYALMFGGNIALFPILKKLLVCISSTKKKKKKSFKLIFVGGWPNFGIQLYMSDYV